MDGSSYEINVDAKGNGVATTADELARLASQLDAAAMVSTSFDSAIERTEALLAQASSAASAAADAVAAGSSKYAQLESAAMRAAKAVDKASQAGKDTAALQAKATAAAAALSVQGVALDELRAKSAAAAGAQTQLAGTLRTLQAAAKAEAAEMKSAAAAAAAAAAKEKAAAEAARHAGAGVAGATKKMQGFKDALEGVAGPGSAAFVEQSTKLVKGLGETGIAGVAGIAAVAVIALGAAALIAVFSLAKLAVTLNKVAMAKIDKIMTRTKKSFAELFSGVHVDKFVKGLDSITKGLDKNTATGKALKSLFETILNPLFDAIPKLVPYVNQLFRGMVLGALLAGIAALRLYIALRNMIPDSVKTAAKDLASNIDWMNTALWAGVVVVGVMALALTVLTAALIIIGAIIASPFILGAIVIAAVAAGVYYAIGAFAGMIAWISAVATYLGNFAAAAWAAADSLIDGLVGGIQSGAGLVMQALKTLGKNAIGALKSALGIASPSKHALAFAANVTETFSGEIEDGAGDVHGAMSTLAEFPEPPKPGGGGGKGSSPRGGANLSGATFNFYGVKDAEHSRSLLEETLTRIVQNDVLELGGSLDPEPAA